MLIDLLYENQRIILSIYLKDTKEIIIERIQKMFNYLISENII